jgi:hypothetical protein
MLLCSSSDKYNSLFCHNPAGRKRDVYHTGSPSTAFFLYNHREVGSEIYPPPSNILYISSRQWAVKIPDIEQGRVLVFVNCKECAYYMFFKPETDSIEKYRKL